ncbi:CBS domain-containing protein [Chloroflexi bacterium TSY]|nr:CBS domain-containing protein [Chloroflexi bacterium TSY]
MIVREYMSSPAITIQSDTPLPDALRVMREHKIRRLPVLDHRGHLAGIVSERDLLHASPSPATSLSIWEVNYLLAKLQIDELMTKSVVTVSPDHTLDEAANLLIAHKIGGLPVVDAEGHVLGVLTETDIFRAFVQRHTSRKEMDVFLVKENP